MRTAAFSHGRGTANGTLVPTDKIGSIAVTSGQNGINYYFGDVLAVTLSGTVYEDNKATGVYATGDVGIGGVSLTLSGTNDQSASITATTTSMVAATPNVTFRRNVRRPHGRRWIR